MEFRYKVGALVWIEAKPPYQPGELGRITDLVSTKTGEPTWEVRTCDGFRSDRKQSELSEPTAHQIAQAQASLAGKDPGWWRMP